MSKFFNLPAELIIDIFAWIDPSAVLKFQRLSHRINDILSSKNFAVVNMRRSKPRDPGYHKISSSPTIWFNLPANHQSEYATKNLWSLSKIQWRMKLSPLHNRLPESVGQLNQLVILDLATCGLAGLIPEALCSLSVNLRRLNLGSNNLTGAIPKNIGALNALEFLFLHNNKLDGCIPSSFAGLKKLRHLCLSENMLSGEIPNSIFELPAIESIDLENNLLTGVICLSSISNGTLRNLNLSNNHQLNIENLRLNNCKLTGNIAFHI
ncbi:hypothetical protein HK100_001775 [Physocladia obscura]|uniref:F-box domain-containing protein n=1 Tax=Physocladia obscura TaxID=109957 RepID=A0AAD5SXZ4_9FUNG|nr:hypothetical protein HK100_001775 [Physocladia obscura]